MKEKSCRTRMGTAAKGAAGRGGVRIKNFSANQTISGEAWWGMVDSNHRRRCQQIYSLSPLATREIPHIKHIRLELVDGFEPPTC